MFVIVCYFLVFLSSVSFYNVEKSQNEEKPMNEQGFPIDWYCMCINVLISISRLLISISRHQLKGRSMRVLHRYSKEFKE